MTLQAKTPAPTMAGLRALTERLAELVAERPARVALLDLLEGGRR